MSVLGSLTVVGVGEIGFSAGPGELVTYALGSCVAVVAWDPRVRAGGLWHAMLPDSSVNPERAGRQPGAFADRGAEPFMDGLRALGASPRRLRLWLIGGADSGQLGPGFEIGRRNVLALRRELWQRGLLVDGEDCGGSESRTVRLDLESGRVQVRHPWGTQLMGERP